MTKTTFSIYNEVRRFFEELPRGREDSFYVADDLISESFAFKICRDFGIHCTHFLPDAKYRFQRSGFRQEHLAKFQTIIA